ncbi:NAD(P)H-quinone oxidoreductase subunit 2, chloroplastic [bioreactor metagenome]|uniref:NAD(P)H-quinone oxidoreductase subunit 2, chloroplastic n=1 Tax=bioreactor metagenome TaxID=1076179 RepID=A0A644WJ02_9ZZZZ
MVLGAVLALFSVDLKRTLACSSMSQIGFIMLGVAMQGFLGEENSLAALGTVLHMMNHSLIKLVLFVGAGVVYLGTHSLNLNEIRGWGRNKPWLKVCFFIGTASICGIPLFSGYVSKTLLHESVVEYIHLLEGGAAVGLFHAAEWLFLITGGLTIAYMTKIFVAVFVEPKAKGQHDSQNYMAGETQIALGIGSLVMAILGLTPSLTMQKIGAWAGEFLRAGELEEKVHYFSLVNLEGAAISIAIGAAVYFLVVRTLLRKEKEGEILYLSLWPQILDLEDLVYRPLIQAVSFAGAVCARIAASVGDFITLVGEKLLFLRAPGVFVPKRNENFGVYQKKPKIILIKEAFSFSLMLSGLGVVVTLLYILL